MVLCLGFGLGSRERLLVLPLLLLLSLLREVVGGVCRVAPTRQVSLEHLVVGGVSGGAVAVRPRRDRPRHRELRLGFPLAPHPGLGLGLHLMQVGVELCVAALHPRHPLVSVGELEAVNVRLILVHLVIHPLLHLRVEDFLGGAALRGRALLVREPVRRVLLVRGQLVRGELLHQARPDARLHGGPGLPRERLALEALGHRARGGGRRELLLLPRLLRLRSHPLEFGLEGRVVVLLPRHVRVDLLVGKAVRRGLAVRLTLVRRDLLLLAHLHTRLHRRLGSQGRLRHLRRNLDLGCGGGKRLFRLRHHRRGLRRLGRIRRLVCHR
mmetsp:Transcript_60650/g.144223  ORF Transcript_60650/g.144223 Transcript_60650/m.144223 type:complete len:325 (-) Transcript_60650:619-1593(-)